MAAAERRITIDGRLALRAWRAEDVPALYAVIDANRDYLAHWLPWAAEWDAAERPRAFVERAQAGYERGTGLDLALERDGDIAGAIGLSPIDPRAAMGEIGYWVAEPHQGRGFVTRGCRALIAHARDALGLRHFVIRVATENTRSRAVAERLGFSLVAIRAEVDPPRHGRSGDEAVYVFDVPPPGRPASRS